MEVTPISKQAKVCQMRTRIRILAPTDTPNAAGYRNPGYANIYPDDRMLRCQWVSAYGNEAVQAQSLGMQEPATITMRYDPRITADCIIVKGDGEKAPQYEIVSPPNDVGDAHRWLEIRVKRRVASQ